MNSENFQQIISNTKIDFHELFLLSFKFLPNSFYEINEFNSQYLEKNSKKVYIKLNENEDEKNEINFWLRDSDSEFDQLIKKKYIKQNMKSNQFILH